MVFVRNRKVTTIGLMRLGRMHYPYLVFCMRNKQYLMGLLPNDNKESGGMMAREIKKYKIDEFLRLTEFGEIDIEKSKQIVRDLAASAAFHQNANILIDLRATTVDVERHLASLLELVAEAVRYQDIFQNKIANIIPNNEKRIEAAQLFKDLLAITNCKYEFFTSYEEAMEWLASTDILCLKGE